MQLPRLKEWRESRGLMQKELASAAEISEFTVLRAEGGTSIRPSTARKIADALEISVADLMERPPVPLGEAPPGGRPTIVEVAQDAARRQITQEAKPDRLVFDMHHANEGARRLREEYALSGADAENLIDYVLRHEREEAAARSRQRAAGREQAFTE